MTAARAFATSLNFCTLVALLSVLLEAMALLMLPTTVRKASWLSRT